MGKFPRSGAQGQNIGIHRKVLSLEILMCNKKALALTVQNLLARYINFRSWGHENLLSKEL